MKKCVARVGTGGAWIGAWGRKEGHKRCKQGVCSVEGRVMHGDGVAWVQGVLSTCVCMMHGNGCRVWTTCVNGFP